MTAQVTHKAAVGVAWMTSARFAVRALGFVSTLALARLLTPADFGLVAMAMVVAAGLELLTLFNFDMALVQTKQLTRQHYDSVWTLNMLMGASLAVVLVALTVPVARFYREPRLEVVMPLIALKYLIDNLGNPGTVDFRRALDFRPDFFMQVWPKVAGVLVTVPLAFWLRDYRALLAGMLLTSTVGCLVGYIQHPHRPRWCLAEARGLFRFSRWLLLNNLMSFLRNRSADLIVGRLLGPASLGVFSIASELANLPSTEMVAPINRVLFPSYVQLAGEPERLRAGFRSTLGWIALLVLPVCIGLAALADPLVRVLLGPKWLQAIPLVALMAVAGGAVVLQATTGSIYNALGLPRMVALTGAIHAAMLLPLLLALIPWFGLVGAASAVLVNSAALGIFVTYWIFVRTTPVRVVDIAGVCWRPIVGSALMFAALGWLAMHLPPADDFASSLVALAFGCVTGAVTYLATVFALWAAAGRPEGPEGVLVRRIAQWRRRPEGAADRPVERDLAPEPCRAEKR